MNYRAGVRPDMGDRVSIFRHKDVLLMLFVMLLYDRMLLCVRECFIVTL